MEQRWHKKWRGRGYGDRWPESKEWAEEKSI